MTGARRIPRRDQQRQRLHHAVGAPRVTFVASTGDQSVGEYPAYSPTWSRWGHHAAAPIPITASPVNGLEHHGRRHQQFRTGADLPETPCSRRASAPFPTSPSTPIRTRASPFTTATSSPAGSKWGAPACQAPSLAGIMALANQGRVAAGLGTFNSSSNPQHGPDRPLQHAQQRFSRHHQRPDHA